MDNKQYRVVVQLNEPDASKHQAVLKNVENLLNDMPEAEVELVVHGAGIGLLRSPGTVGDKDLRKLKDRGVILAACANTLREKDIPKESIFDFATIVSSGVGEVVRRQADGWIYLKP